MNVWFRLALTPLLFAVATAAFPAWGHIRLDVSAASLRLSGRVPSMAQRETLHRLLHPTPRQALVDHLVVDRTDTEPWPAATTQVWEPASRALTQGTICLEGNRLTVSGSLPSEDAKNQLLRLLEPVRRAGLTVKTSLSVQAPEPSPWLEARWSPVSRELTGRVALEETVGQLRSPLTGTLSIQTGSTITPASWESDVAPRLPALLAALLPLVPEGSLRLEPERVTLRGTASGLDRKLHATALITSVVGLGLRVENYLAIPGPSPSGRSPAPLDFALLFRTGSSSLAPGSRSILQRAIHTFFALPSSARVVLYPPANQTTSAPGNLTHTVSGPARAEEVRRLLMESGVPGERVEISTPSPGPEPCPDLTQVEIVLFP